jgi:hypothetical protein
VAAIARSRPGPENPVKTVPAEHSALDPQERQLRLEQQRIRTVASEVCERIPVLAARITRVNIIAS